MKHPSRKSTKPFYLVRNYRVYLMETPNGWQRQVSRKEFFTKGDPNDAENPQLLYFDPLGEYALRHFPKENSHDTTRLNWAELKKMSRIDEAITESYEQLVKTDNEGGLHGNNSDFTEDVAIMNLLTSALSGLSEEKQTAARMQLDRHTSREIAEAVNCSQKTAVNWWRNEIQPLLQKAFKDSGYFG